MEEKRKPMADIKSSKKSDCVLIWETFAGTLYNYGRMYKDIPVRIDKYRS